MLKPLPLLCLLCLGCGSGRVQTLGGPADYLKHINAVRWDKPVVLYRIHGGPFVGASVVRQTVKSGIHQWDQTFEGILTLREATGDEPADIDIKFVPVGSLGGSFLGNQVLGRDQEPEEHRHWRSVPAVRNGVFQSVTIKLDSQLWARLPTLKRITAHELMHATFGNQGHSPYPSDLGHSPPQTSSPNVRDTTTARMVYGR